MGIGFDVVPYYFRWKLIVWKPMEEQFRAELEGKPAEVFGKVHQAVEVGEETSEEGNQNGFGNM